MIDLLYNMISFVFVVCFSFGILLAFVIFICHGWGPDYDSTEEERKIKSEKFNATYEVIRKENQEKYIKELERKWGT